jgi:hypothetical protein
VVRVESSVPLTTAEKQPLTTGDCEQLGRLGGTPFRGELKNQLEAVIVPISGTACVGSS